MIEKGGFPLNRAGFNNPVMNLYLTQ